VAVCYLIMVHKDPDQIFALLERLYNEIDYFYVHVDAKHPRLKEAIKGSPLFSFENVRLESHTKCTWGGIGLVDVQLRAITDALQSSDQWTHFINLSGQDYPLKSADQIRNKLDVGCSYLEAFPLRREWPRAMRRVKSLYFELPFGNRKIVPLLPFRFGTSRFDWFGGSTWFTLSRKACEYSVFSDNAHQLRRYLTYSKCSDEIFFHTLLCDKSYKGEVVKNNFRHIEWDGPLGFRSPHPREYLPADLDELKVIMQSKKFFVRKLKYSAPFYCQLSSFLDMS
jgi:hypothetical protein